MGRKRFSARGGGGGSFSVVTMPTAGLLRSLSGWSYCSIVFFLASVFLGGGGIALIYCYNNS